VSKKREEKIRIDDLPQDQPKELSPEQAGQATGGRQVIDDSAAAQSTRLLGTIGSN
jgi:hypothetical protein